MKQMETHETNRACGSAYCKQKVFENQDHSEP